MDGYRLLNLVMQTVYLPIHMIFIIKLIKRRQPSPVWKWFIVVVVGLWGIIAGRWVETLLYLFWQNDAAYAATVDFTLTSTTLATMSFLFWNLYIAGHDRLAEAKWFSNLIRAVSLLVCIIFITNPLHHLFYEHLELNGLKTHGKLFAFCVLIVYGMLFAGLIISIVHIVKYEDSKIKRIIVFSMYPILPGVTNLIRSLSGVDTIDYNPLVMSLSILCLYEIVFKESYVGVVSESIESVLEQTGTPILLYDSSKQNVIYENKAARTVHDTRVEKILLSAADNPHGIREMSDGRVVRADSSGTKNSNEFIVTLTDVTELINQQKKIDNQIEQQNRMLESLAEQKRNIEAYIEALNSIPDLKEKKDMADRVQLVIVEAFDRLEKNLFEAKAAPQNSERVLEDNIRIARETITSIREVVARLKEVS